MMLPGQGQIEWARRHYWLGLLWCPQEGLIAAAKQRIAIATAQISTLAGMISNNIIPLAIGNLLVQAKAGNSLAFGRWLWGAHPEAQDMLDEAYCGWAKSMLGAPAWRSSAVARGEMGWCISGAGLATLEAAKKRAKLWLLPPADFFRLSFVTGHKDQTRWASISLHTLTTWGNNDWPKWSATVPSPSLKGYSEYVRATVTRRSVTKWSAEAGNMSSQCHT